MRRVFLSLLRPCPLCCQLILVSRMSHIAQRNSSQRAHVKQSNRSSRLHWSTATCSVNAGRRVLCYWVRHRWGERRRHRCEWKPQWDDTPEDYIGLYWSEVDWASDGLIWFIDRAHHQCEWLWAECAASHWSPPAPMLHLTGRLAVVYMQRMELGGGMSESGRLSGILGTCGAYQSLNLSLSLEDWENFSIVHAPLTFCLLSQELLCDWAWLAGESACMSRPQETWKSQFVLRAVFMLLTRYSWSAARCFQPFLSLSACPLLTFTYLLTHVKHTLKKHTFMCP